MKTKNYLELVRSWPQVGRHILGQFDERSIYVYQAYRPSIAEYAVANQRFGGDFSYARMSWIKPNFLWMMYRSGWATKEGQERILAIRLGVTFFDELLRSSVPSSRDPERFDSDASWRQAVAESDVRMQWDPDHDPSGRALERRAVQLGLRGEMLRRYGEREVLSITDITDFVAVQRRHLESDIRLLEVPSESVYVPEVTAARVAGVEAVPV
ncbi:DUF4291 domain-containing protein [Dyella mobilis]|uniref:DUF4291 domain-containing protein n=2 Tax=Dyella mobilis TaxID=1849582 RepID=A0ABS2KF19_9GAMM|nr:DUF4291 domain-containing protein [Dyella mobilis]